MPGYRTLQHMHTRSGVHFCTMLQAERELFLEGYISLKLWLETAHTAFKQHRSASLWARKHTQRRTHTHPAESHSPATGK